MAARFTPSPVLSQIWRQRPIQLPHQCGAACRYDPTVRLATDATPRQDSNVVDGDWLEPTRSCRCSYSAGQAVLAMALQSGGMREHHIGAGSIAVDSDNARLTRGERAGLVKGDQPDARQRLKRGWVAHQAA